MDKKEDEKNVVTYETFRKFQRMERDSEQLQKLPENFYELCANWMRRKEKLYKETNDPLIVREIENLMTIIKDIIDRRERKLLLLAMYSVRGSAVPQNLLPFEEKHFDVIVEQLKEMRDEVFSIIKGKPQEQRPREEVEEKADKEMEVTEESETPIKEEPEKEYKEEIVEQKPQRAKEPKLAEPSGFKLVKILNEIPQFLGTDGRSYGPFMPDDIVTLEDEVADLLIKKGRAEKINI
ncbi:MAG: DNA replication complex GINS family protein [Candidatus Aenigmarchaeota archaeon]|nr:DNA replication complex GINS family protein [Candidatus Aenigmarchaeota archaeon]